MDKNEIPTNASLNRRRGESRWQRFWRRRRMDSIRNSSNYAVFIAISLVTIVLILGVIAFFGMRGADFQNSSPAGLELFNR